MLLLLKVVPIAECHAVRLQAALKLHQQGSLDEAEAIYREIMLAA